ncbi:hypothetical protein GLAREA_04961 [Glarea lozoyensis ATCC 20868]|uniref:Transmembrane protein n=1 Tax=Glarea lozoyensis (strain ATCC 20868 / MF5171) TaxID=1116229 RepID=S3CR71_GLAL2|nr:uncharacterized protein GLAREA_04961 [Glarea lozoyensis ATCC 20868]EPE28170.1 hypothetical protein GLAREA_04961 [Glarea lozoyensis ATCC 20868]
MITLLSEHYVAEPVSGADLQLASLAWGFTIGFGFLTTWTAIKQTADIQRRHGYSKLNTPYIWMVWLEILVCLTFSIICWLHLNEIIPPSFAFFFVILTTWALQVQFLLQIIINRVSILLVDRQKAMRLRIGVAVLITAINISVYCIWVPARLQVSAEYGRINNIWDRCEKVIYLLVDAALNWYFIRTVQHKLVDQGLVKYNRLVRFNMWIIGLSLSMDVLIISMMSLKNSFVYMQFHPFAYIVKLNIEMSMADLIAKVSRINPNWQDPGLSRTQDSSNITKCYHDSQSRPKPSYLESYSPSSDVPMDDMLHPRDLTPSRAGGLEIHMSSEVRIDVERRDSSGTKEGSELELVNAAGPMEADEIVKEEIEGRRRARKDT